MKKPLSGSLFYRNGASPTKRIKRAGYQLLTSCIVLSGLAVTTTVHENGEVTITYENEAGVTLHETSENLFTLLKNEG